MDNKSLLDKVEKVLFSEKAPVPFREFIESKEYCNNNTLYEFWKEEIEKLPARCDELVLDGSIGSGKTTAALYYIAYRIYCLFLIGDWKTKYGLDPETEVYVIYFSVSMTMAKRSGFKKLQNIILSCKWFRDNAPVNEALSSEIQIPSQKFQIVYGSAEGHQIGLDVWGVILDESNFRNGVGTGVASEYQEVTSLYTQLQDRLISRFARPDGTVEALSILISSASYQSAFCEKRRVAIQGKKNKAHIRGVKYKVTPQNYSKEMFTVFIGTSTLEPCIVKDDEHRKLIERSLDSTGSGYNKDMYFEQVPVSIKTSFIENIYLALQNQCGVPTQIKGRFLQDMMILKQCYTNEEPEWFRTNIVVLSSEDEIQLEEYLIPENIQYPDRPHSFFIDLSIAGDSGGFSCYRFDGEKDGYRYHTHVFTLEIVPPPPPFQTRITKILIFMQVINQLVNVAAFGSDNFQSVGMRQDVCAALNLQDIRLSIDSSDNPHLQLVRAMIDKTVSKRYVPKLETEYEEAEHNLKRHRVEKRQGSTDDLMQSDVGAFFLSDTVGAQQGDVASLLGNRVNAVGASSYNKILRKLGYTQPKVH